MGSIAKTSSVLLTGAFALFIAGDSLAQTLTGFKVSPTRVEVGAPLTALIEYRAVGKPFCGVMIDWGDGESPQGIRVGREPDNDSPISRQRSYKKPGTYTIKAYGAYLPRGLNSADECSGQLSAVTISVFEPGIESSNPLPPSSAPSQANSATPQTSVASTGRPSQPEPGQAAPELRFNAEDFTIFFKKVSDYDTVRKLDGTRIFRNPQGLRSEQVYCLLRTPESFNNEQSMQVLATLPVVLSKSFSEMGAQTRLTFQHKGCTQEALAREARAGAKFRLDTTIPLLAVFRSAIPRMAGIPGFDQYVEGPVIKGAELVAAFAAAQEREHLAKERERVNQDARASLERELYALAEQKSKEKIGSITLRHPMKRENLKICSRKGSEEFNIATQGYFSTQKLRVSSAFIDAAVAQNSQINRSNPITSIFEDADDFFVRIQRDPGICQVYIDYPENLALISKALARRKIEVNPLIPVAEAKNDWALRRGYSDFGAYEFARDIKGNQEQVKQLAEFGVATPNAFNLVAQRMIKQGYSKEPIASELLNFLRDEREGSAAKMTATAVKKKREKDAELAAQKRKQDADLVAQKRKQEAEAERIARASKYPYYAVISCGFGENLFPFHACFSSSRGSGTELKFTQGSIERVYKIYELINGKIGQVNHQSLHIDLPESFRLSAQNSSDSLTLTLRIYERRSNTLLMQRQAGSLYAVVSASK
jgi:hypothetical protein